MSAPSHAPYPPRTAGLHPDTPAWLGQAFNAAEFRRGDNQHVTATMRLGGFPVAFNRGGKAVWATRGPEGTR